MRRPIYGLDPGGAWSSSASTILPVPAGGGRLVACQRVPVASAGTRPAARVHPRAVKVGRRHGLALGKARTAQVQDILQPSDLLIAVCDNAFEELPDSARPRLHWAVPDPARVDTDAAFEAAYVEIAQRVERLADAMQPSGPEKVGMNAESKWAAGSVRELGRATVRNDRVIG